MAKLTLEKLQKHNKEVMAGGVGLEKANDVRETIESELGAFTKEVYQVRSGSVEDKRGNKLAPYDISLQEATKIYFGCDLKHFYKGLGIFTGSDNIRTVARRFGLENLNKMAMESLLIEHANFGDPMATPDINTDYRFIIPEIFTNAIRTGYLHASMHQNWIASTTNMSQETLKMPFILRGDGMPSKVNEGANIPMGSINFGKKEVGVFKIGTGFSITDELLMASTLDLLFIFLQEVGNDMSIGADTLAWDVLLNGEQSDGSESAPVVGVNATADGFTYRDLKKVFTRMRRLNQPADRIVTGEDDGIDITSIDRFEGFNGQSKLASVRSIIGVPEQFDIDTYVPPSDQIMFINKARAMTKLQYRGMMTERRRNPQNQTEELFISDWINFAIIKRDARVLLDKSVTIGASPFPAYMDIDSRIAAAYKSI